MPRGSQRLCCCRHLNSRKRCCGTGSNSGRARLLATRVNGVFPAFLQFIDYTRTHRMAAVPFRRITGKAPSLSRLSPSTRMTCRTSHTGTRDRCLGSLFHQKDTGGEFISVGVTFSGDDTVGGLAREFYSEEPNPAGGRQRDLLGLYKQQRKPF